MAKKDTENKEVVETTNVNPEETKAPEVTSTPEPAPEEPKEPEEKPAVSKKIKKLADETDAGKYGSGRERMILLGDNYVEVQAEVNRRYIEKNRFRNESK